LGLDDYEIEYCYRLLQCCVLLQKQIIEYEDILENDDCQIVECDIIILKVEFQPVLDINDADLLDNVCHIL